MESFFTELRRRNVLRVAAAYALVAWILIEAGSVLLPTFGAPDWYFRVYVVIVAMGFVLSLIFAWIFEITPEGVKRESEVDHSVDRPRKQGFNVVIITLLGIALAVSVSFNISGVRTQAPEVLQAVDRSSIAVLPFQSRSSDPDNVFFADGIHDDLLTRLADLESLRVISRTSVMKYRDTTKDVPQIAEELGVAAVVAGAVQRAGDQVRITIRLVDAVTDEQIWAHTYDEDLTLANVFTIQSQVSAKIAQNLRARLSADEEQRLAAVPTTSMNAYRMFVAGRKNLWERRFDTLQDARRQFEQAIEIDPDYAQAYAGLAETLMILFINHSAISPDEAFRLAEAAASKAMALDPELAEAHAVTGLIELNRWKDTRLGDGNLRAAASFERAIDLSSNLTNSYVWFASLRQLEGADDDAVRLLEHALEIDPLARIPYLNLADLHARSGDNGKTLSVLLRATELFPDWPSAYQNLANHLEGLGRLDEAVAWTRYSEPLNDDPLHFGPLLKIYQKFGQIEKIMAFAKAFPDDHPMLAVGASYVHALLGEFAEARELLEAEIEHSELPHPYTYPILVASAAQLGDYEAARTYLLESNPALEPDTRLVVDYGNLHAVVLLGYIERQRGAERTANELLENALSVINELPRTGILGHGIEDVRVLALLDRKSAALIALREAIDDGFAGYRSHSVWTIDNDPMIAPLRGDPAYEAMREEIEQRIEALRRNVEAAEQTGDWTPLLDKVRNRATAEMTAQHPTSLISSVRR